MSTWAERKAVRYFLTVWALTRLVLSSAIQLANEVRVAANGARPFNAQWTRYDLTAVL